MHSSLYPTLISNTNCGTFVRLTVVNALEKRSVYIIGRIKLITWKRHIGETKNYEMKYERMYGLISRVILVLTVEKVTQSC